MSQTFSLAAETTKAFPFEAIGATVTGKVVDMTETQQTDMKTGEPKTFDNGDPMMMFRLILATDLRDPSEPTDNGYRAVYLRGSRKSDTKSTIAAVLDAVKTATGATDLAVGGTLSLTYVGDGPRQAAGFTPPKLYTATYAPPSLNLEPPQQPAYAASPPSAPYTPPAQQQPAAPATSGYSPEQIAALRAANIDPATMQPIAR